MLGSLRTGFTKKPVAPALTIVPLALITILPPACVDPPAFDPIAIEFAPCCVDPALNPIAIAPEPCVLRPASIPIAIAFDPWLV